MSTKGGARDVRRFDIVVFNYERLPLFFGNFGKLRNYDPSRDRITIVSASPSPTENQQIREFEDQQEVSVRYLTRTNRGIDQLGRAQYFTGAVGSVDENLSHAYIFQMQDHYLATNNEASRWGPELGLKTKGDVIPDGVVFDLDSMERLAQQHDLTGFFCDRNNPCFISLGGRRFVAPNGGNFIIRSDTVRNDPAQRACQRLIRTCDGTYRWAVYAEFMWGLIFFQEGERFYDLKRELLFEAWEEEDFYIAPDDFPRLKRFYDRPAVVRMLRRGLAALRRALSSVLRHALA